MAPALPVKIWGIIFKNLNFTSRKQLRLIDSELKCLVTPNLFKTVSFNLNTSRVNRLIAIAASEELYAHV